MHAAPGALHTSFEPEGHQVVPTTLPERLEGWNTEVREEGDDTKMLGMCLGVTSHYTKARVYGRQ